MFRRRGNGQSRVEEGGIMCLEGGAMEDRSAQSRVEGGRGLMCLEGEGQTCMQVRIIL